MKNKVANILSLAALAWLAAQARSDGQPMPPSLPDKKPQTERLDPTEREAILAFRAAGHDVALNSDGQATMIIMKPIYPISEDQERGCEAISKFTHAIEFKCNDGKVSDRTLARLGGLARLNRAQIIGTFSDKGLQSLAHLNDLEFLWLSSPNMTGDGLRFAANLPKLKEIQLSGSNDTVLKGFDAGFAALRLLRIGGNITGRGMAPIGHLTNLEEFDFYGVIDDNKVKSLAPLKHLRRLNGIWILTDDAIPFLAQMDDLRDVALGASDVSQQGLAKLSRLRNVESLRVPARFSDTELAYFSNWKKLDSIALSDTSVTDAGMRYLGAMPSLLAIGLERTRVGDAGLAHLSRLPKLQTLHLGSTQVTDAGLAHVAKIGTLRSLNLDNTRITDAGLREVARLGSLEVLSLSQNAISDAGLAHLAGLTELSLLNLSFTEVTNQGLDQLTGLKKLSELDLSDTYVTTNGAHRLLRRIGKGPFEIRVTPPEPKDNDAPIIP